jgi:uncharacterized protein YdaU (DUF1376 family)
MARSVNGGLHIGDYHRETRHLTAEQHAKGGLPNDDTQLARIALVAYGGRRQLKRATNKPRINAGLIA